MLADDDDADGMPDEIEPLVASQPVSYRTARLLLDGYERLCREHAILSQPMCRTPTGMLEEVETLLHDTHLTLLDLLQGHPLHPPASIHLHSPKEPP